MQWSDYLKLQGYTDTIGEDHDPATGLPVFTPPGKFNPGHQLVPGLAGTQPGRYGQPATAGPLHQEGSFVDPSVLDEYAAAKGLDLVKATDTDREDIRWVTQPVSQVTFYAGVLRPWLLERDKPTTKPPAAAELAELKAQVDDQERRLRAVEDALAAKGRRG